MIRTIDTESGKVEGIDEDGVTVAVIKKPEKDLRELHYEGYDVTEEMDESQYKAEEGTRFI